MRSISTAATRAATSSASATSPAVGAPKLVPLRRRLDDGREHCRVGMPVDQRPPRADVVDVAVAVDVDHLGALAARDEQRIAPDRAHRPHGELTPPGISSRARR